MPLRTTSRVGPQNTDYGAGCSLSAVIFLGVCVSACYELLMVLVSIAVRPHRVRGGRGLLQPVRGDPGRLRRASRGPRRPEHWGVEQHRDAARLDEAYTGLPGVLWGAALAPVGLALAGWGGSSGSPPGTCASSPPLTPRPVHGTQAGPRGRHPGPAILGAFLASHASAGCARSCARPSPRWWRHSSPTSRSSSRFSSRNSWG